MAVVWDDSLKERVRSLWPTHSSGEIADTLRTADFYVSRQSISALAARIGLTASQKTRDTTRANPFGMLSDGRAKKPTVEEPLISQFYAEDVSAENVHGIDALGQDDCRFIINSDTAAPVYCGAKIAHNRLSWCRKHFERCHLPRSEERAA